MLATLLLVVLTGCGHLKHKQENETVYVLSKQTFLRDRVAAVSNRVAMVQNGQKLELLERGRRFLRVKTEQGEIGWIEEHAVVNPEVITGFEELQKAHAKDPVIATAVLRDDGYLHVKPGRDTDRFYLLPEGDKLQLLVRASVPKAIGPQASGTGSSYAGKPSATIAKRSAKAKAADDRRAADKAADAATRPAPPAPPSAPPVTLTSPGTGTPGTGTSENAPVQSGARSEPAATLAPKPPVPMEDWWLVRDSGGKVGWLMSRRLDVDVPDEIAGYADGQRIVGAYLLQKVNDPESSFADKQAPEYVTVLNPYQDGLPYDFSQVRVFTWNLRKHRYETAFRQRNIRGYLPVVVENLALDNQGPNKQGPVPTFRFKQGVGDGVIVDPESGAIHPAASETLTYRLDGEQVRKVDPAAPAPVVRPQPTAQTPATGRHSSRRGKHAGEAKRHPRH
ncbi:hypothetical protein ACPOL_2039 [Acidisarcina polymorpha]|uniref:SH3b domain-containing protein n=1 Tax=Acidisarcina polymorpha TaxID=2211140 RepID=A0A2Z5FY99_9BACT|nr:hypothetical protein ACPOL_2039 [Acidisarcina polymorpha]